MALATADKSTRSIEGFSLDGRKTDLGDLAAYTHKNFHDAIRVLRESNTLEGILKYFIDEVDELLEFLEDAPDDRVNIVAELGDLLHFWNDLFQLSDASISTLLKFMALDSLEEDMLTIAQLRSEAAVDQARQFKVDVNQLDAIKILYDLKNVLQLGEDDQIDADLIGVIASHIFAVAAALDVNPIYAVLMKNIRNRQKYKPALMNFLRFLGFDYDRITKIMVTLWNGGDTKFFKEFLEQFPIEWSYTLALQLAKGSN